MVRRLNPAAWWRRQQRKIDHEILFPQIVLQANGDEQAMAQALIMHIAIDSAWQCHPSELSKRDVEIMLKATSCLPPNDSSSANGSAANNQPII